MREVTKKIYLKKNCYVCCDNVVKLIELDYTFLKKYINGYHFVNLSGLVITLMRDTKVPGTRSSAGTKRWELIRYPCRRLGILMNLLNEISSTCVR